MRRYLCSRPIHFPREHFSHSTSVAPAGCCCPKSKDLLDVHKWISHKTRNMEEEDVDYLFFWSKSVVNKKFILKGFQKNDLVYTNNATISGKRANNADLGHWQLIDKSTKAVLFMLSTNGYPFGKHRWLKAGSLNHSVEASLDGCSGINSLIIGELPTISRGFLPSMKTQL